MGRVLHPFFVIMSNWVFHWVELASSAPNFPGEMPTFLPEAPYGNTNKLPPLINRWLTQLAGWIGVWGHGIWHSWRATDELPAHAFPQWGCCTDVLLSGEWGSALLSGILVWGVDRDVLSKGRSREQPSALKWYIVLEIPSLSPPSTSYESATQKCPYLKNIISSDSFSHRNRRIVIQQLLCVALMWETLC